MTSEAVPLPRNAERLHPFSRFASQKFYITDGVRYWGTWEPVFIPGSAKDIYLTVDEAMERRLDLIAYKFYGSPELWWVLAEVNNIFFPAEELEVGVQLRIPSKTTLLTMNIIR